SWYKMELCQLVSMGKNKKENLLIDY
ncbi:MAG: hypothetical protein K0S71_2876, partial [Clostridia bacterium]|nr:hypothetical protein [Clostridia bacterium]MDF2615090.1 hypothetical protein [Clostridia bacterium]